jgi:hypothetical protein
MFRLDAAPTLDSKASQIETSTDKSPASAPAQAMRPAWIRFAFPSAADLIFVILLAAMTIGLLAQRLLGDAGIGWHIRNGQQILSRHSVTRIDPFSAIMSGHKWYAWEWLYDLKVAAIHDWFGLNGVVLFTAVIIAATFALALRLSLRRGADLPAAVVLLALSLGASTIHLLARPHVLSWLFTVIWFQILDDSEAQDPAKRRRLWGLPGLMLLWANLHGGFVLGFVLLGLYFLGATIRYFRCPDNQMREGLAGWMRELGMVTAASLLASLINPYGYELHAHVFQYLSNRWLMNHIDEFLSPNFHGVAQQCFVLLLLITLGGLAVVRTKPPLSRVFVLLFAAYSGLYASRSLPVSSLLLMLIVSPLLSQAVTETRANPELPARLRAWLSRWESLAARMGRAEVQLRGHLWPAAAIVLGTLICAHQGKLGSHRWMDAHFDAQHFPVEAAEVIAQRGIRDPIFSLDSWGGYLIYRLYPQIRVFVDDRHDLYGEEFLKTYLQTVRLTPEWDNLLNEKRVDWVLAPAESPLANMLVQTSRWETVHRDGTAVLLRRKPRPRPQPNGGPHIHSGKGKAVSRGQECFGEVDGTTGSRALPGHATS